MWRLHGGDAVVEVCGRVLWVLTSEASTSAGSAEAGGGRGGRRRAEASPSERRPSTEPSKASPLLLLLRLRLLLGLSCPE